MSHENDLISCNLAKILIKIISQHHSDATGIEIFIKSLTSTITKKLSNVGNQTTRESILVLVKAIGGLQKFFLDKLVGCIHIIKLITSIDNLESHHDVQQIIEETTNMNINATSFINRFFMNEKNEEFYKLCIALAQKINTDNNINVDLEIFCCYMIEACSKNSTLIEKNPKLYSDMTNSIIKLILYNELKDIDNFLVKGILNKDILHGAFCFDIITQVFLNITDRVSIIVYFKFFQKLMLKIWSPLSTISTMQQVRIAEILNLLYELYGEELKDVIDDKIKTLLGSPSAEKDDDFVYKIQLLKTEPSLENYEKLFNSLRAAEIDKFTQEKMKSFLDLIELLESCDSTEFTPLIIEILKRIKSCKQIDKKMIILLRLETSINKSMPTEAREILLEIIFSCMPDIDKFKGFSTLIEASLDKLLNKSYALRRVWYNLIDESGENLNDKFMINDESLTYPKNFHIIQPKLKVDKRNLKHEKTDDPTKSKYLRTILSYSDKLKIKSTEKLSEKDRKVIEHIIINFKFILDDN